MAGKIYIGTSGWVYKGWARTFYPEAMPARRHLEFYAAHFPTVEINASFYRLPNASTFEAWREAAPPGFIYAVKGSRAVTHFKKLLPGAKSFDLLLERARALEDHLGPLLWQLPPGFKKNAARLESFLQTLPRGLRHAVEFREPSWLDAEIFTLLRTAGVANVALSSQAMPMNTEATAPFVYVRFHGLAGGVAHDYTDAELEPWSRYLQTCAESGLDAFVYFNNDVNTRAPNNAMRLMEMAGSHAVKPIPKHGDRDAKSTPDLP